MHDALGDALMVEMKDLFAEMEVLDQTGAALTELEGVLVVSDRSALGSGEDFRLALGNLMEFAAVSAGELLIVNGGFIRGAGRGL
jgi:hypothetical protein